MYNLKIIFFQGLTKELKRQATEEDLIRVFKENWDEDNRVMIIKVQFGTELRAEEWWDLHTLLGDFIQWQIQNRL